MTGVQTCALPIYSAIPTSSNTLWDAATASWAANGYRLPTQMEYAWAAMGATCGTGYSNGTYTVGYLKEFPGDPNPGALGDQISNYAWYSANSLSKTHPVGTKLPNELGLFDLGGNVYEWCWDWSGTIPNGTISDYRGPASGTFRVIKGGSMSSIDATCAVSYRDCEYPYLFNIPMIGLRVVLP